MKKTWQERFWKMVQKTEGCWIWSGSRHEDGYGLMRSEKGLTTVASRLSYLIHFGNFDKKLYVLHRCDNPSCVRPDHLFLGTQRDNVHDMWAKGRANVKGAGPGSLHHRHKLNEVQVIEIRKRFSEGESRSSLAEKFNVSTSSICLMVNRKTWRHI